MKNLAAIVIVLMGIPAFGQLSKNIDSKISNVTVFLNRAQVTREGRVRIEAGQNHLLLKGLPSKIDPQSIQVSGKGNYILLGVNHRHNYLDDMTAPKPLKVLKDSIEILNRSLSLDQSQKEILNREEQLLLANQKFGGTNQSISVSEMKAMADFYRSRLMEITTSRMKVDENMKQKQLRIAKLQQQSFELSNVMNRNTSEIGITLSSQAAASIDLIITYVVPDAGWQPVYDLRAKDTRSPISLSYKANVYQNTGEEWKDVKLSLSTANPNLSGLKPELATWFLDFYAPVAIQYKKQKPMPSAVRGESMAAADISEEEIAPETIADYLETVQTTLNTEFRISLPYTVESSSKPTSVDISNSEIKANYKYAATPKMESDAFLMAYATQWEDLNLLPGLANIFFEGTYVGKTFIDPASVRDTLSLSLGRDKRIVTKRERVKDLTSRSMIGSNIKETWGYEISIRNTKQEPITIRIEDQVPLSRHTDILVSNIEAKDAKINSANGKIVWELVIQPNETKNVSFRFEIKYPKDKIISGL